MTKQLYIGYWIENDNEDFDNWNDETMFLNEKSRPIQVFNSISDNKNTTIDLVIDSILDSGYYPFTNAKEIYSQKDRDFYVWTFNIKVEPISIKAATKLKDKLKQLIE